MPTVTGELLNINADNGDELLLTLKLYEGDIIHINYLFEDERIVDALINSLSDGNLVTCRIVESLDLDSDEPFTGKGSVRQYDFKSVFSDIFGDILSETEDESFTPQEKAALSIFCTEAAKAVKEKFGATASQSAVIDNEFVQLAASINQGGKKAWKKRFLAAMINIGVAFAVDQAVGTTFVLTLAEVVKEVIANLTKRLIRP